MSLHGAHKKPQTAALQCKWTQEMFFTLGVKYTSGAKGQHKALCTPYASCRGGSRGLWSERFVTCACCKRGSAETLSSPAQKAHILGRANCRATAIPLCSSMGPEFHATGTEGLQLLFQPIGFHLPSCSVLHPCPGLEVGGVDFTLSFSQWKSLVHLMIPLKSTGV